MRKSFDIPQRRSDVEKPPAPELRFFFSAHGQIQDYEGIQEALQDADVFVVEAHGWNEDDLRYLQEISDGTKVPRHIEEKREPQDVIEYEEDLLYKTGKRIEIVDVPEGHELDKEDDGTAGISEAARTFIARGDLESALAALDTAVKMNAEYIRKKDEYIEGQLDALLKKLSIEDPNAKVLVQIGSTHTGISHDLRREGIASRVRNSVKFDFKDELVRSYRFKKSPERDLLIKVLIEEVLRTSFQDQLRKVPYIQRVDFFRKHLANITEEQIQNLGYKTESKFFDRVIMRYENYTPELKRQILTESWQVVFGAAIDESIAKLVNQQHDR
ncbi:MAG: hypothetical protein O3B64_00955 [bacterium]|nr:hypothetical protein [bacterium]